MNALGHAAASAIVVRAAARYFAERRRLVPGFAARNFGVRGSLGLHAQALGWDLVRAPLNVALAVPHVATRLAGFGARATGFPGTGAWLAERRILRETAVAREVVWRVTTGLLELPAEHRDGRRSGRDALAEAILAEPEVQALVADAARHSADPAFRARLAASLADYAGTRSAAAEITTALFTLGAGAVLFQQATPGMVTLGPSLAAALAQSGAIASFPLGASLGGVWYGFFPAVSSTTLLVSTTAALAGGAALVSAFAGILADPVQLALGLHRRRLLRLVDALERQFAATDGAGFAAHEHYVARLMDLADVLTGIVRAG
jgi:hypothetical protein